MPHYFARFERQGPDLFWFDTRIYLDDVSECTPHDRLIGAVVGKNPGSSRPSDEGIKGMQPVTLKGGMLLPTVRSIVTQAYKVSGSSWPPGAYVQVLNLFYLCDARFGSAKRRISEIAVPPIDLAEQKDFPWIMYFWGLLDRHTSPFASRFSALTASDHFFFDRDRDTLVTERPDEHSFAKHTQGLLQGPIVRHLATLTAFPR